MRPTFSIITPAYRSSPTIEATIESVRAQSDPDWEMIIVDDGSDDDTLSVARACAGTDSRIRILSQSNGGTSAARNTAMAAASGAWFVLIDADDELMPTYLEAQRAFIGAHPGFGIYATNAWARYPNGFKRLYWGGRYNREFSVSLAKELRRNVINVHCTFPREIYETIGGFTIGLRAQDYEYWLRAMIAGYAHIMNPKPLVLYNVRDGALSTDQSIMIGDVLEFIARLSTKVPEEMRALFDEALVLWQGRLRIIQMQDRMLDDDYRGARRIFFRNARFLPDWRKIPVGGVLVMLSPHLYRRVLLRRFERSRKLIEAEATRI